MAPHSSFATFGPIAGWLSLWNRRRAADLVRAGRENHDLRPGEIASGTGLRHRRCLFPYGFRQAKPGNAEHNQNRYHAGNTEEPLRYEPQRDQYRLQMGLGCQGGIKPFPGRIRRGRWVDDEAAQGNKVCKDGC